MEDFPFDLGIGIVRVARSAVGDITPVRRHLFPPCKRKKMNYQR